MPRTNRGIDEHTDNRSQRSDTLVAGFLSMRRGLFPRPLLARTAALLLLWGCSTNTTFTSTWKAPGAQGIHPAGKTIAALVISSDAASRKSAEVYLANDLTIRGARGIAAYTLLGADHGNGEYARSRLKEAGVDGVVIMRAVGKDQRVTYQPGDTSFSTFGSYYGGFGSYYGYGWQSTVSTGSVRTDTVVAVETLIYSLKDDKLLWAGTSHTTNPDNLSDLVTEVADAVARQAAKQGLIAH